MRRSVACTPLLIFTSSTFFEAKQKEHTGDTPMHAVAVPSVCSPHVVGDEDGEAADEVERDAERAD